MNANISKFANSMEQRELEKTMLMTVLSSFIPEEILRDGFDHETKSMLNDLAIACVIFAFILLPQYCFRTKYQEELDQMRAAGKEPTTIDFSVEEVEEIKKLQLEYERKIREKKYNQAVEKRKRK